MDKLNVLSFSDKYHPTKEQQYTIRLHDHGLLRLIPISAEKDFFQVTNKIFFNTLLTSHVYQELFFDHFSQKSDGKHGPFLLSSLKDSDFVPITNDHLKQEIIQIVSSPKWSCPNISKEKLSEVKKLLDFLINKEAESFFLERCLTFNSSSQEAIVYDHEWSHNLTSYYEYVIKDKANKKAFLLIITYE